jgi:photosystem II stability/assembly factor-like uncharacterized protein
MLRTTNGGTNWTAQSSGTANVLWSVSFADADTGTAVGSSGSILRTINGGTSWTAQSSGTTNSLRGVSFTDANNGTAVGVSGTILRTTNGGTSWTPQLSGTTISLNGVSFTDANTGTVVGGLGTFVGGTRWRAHSSGTTDSRSGITINDHNIFRTTNGGTNWTAQSSGTANWLYSVSFTDANTGTAVGDAGTILHTSNGGVVWVKDGRQGEIQNGFVLEQNYPNPFNPTTNITYSLPYSSSVTLTVYNTLGQQVTTLVHEHQEAGHYQQVWNAEGIASGVYFYRLQAGDFASTRKLILMK